MSKRPPFQSINPDLATEIGYLLEDIQVDATTQAVLAFMKQTTSRKRGTRQYLANLRAVGLLLACASEEQYAEIERNIMGNVF